MKVRFDGWRRLHWMDRLELIDRQQAEWESMGRSNDYRLGYLALNPWQVLKKRLLGNMDCR